MNRDNYDDMDFEQEVPRQRLDPRAMYHQRMSRSSGGSNWMRDFNENQGAQHQVNQMDAQRYGRNRINEDRNLKYRALQQQMDNDRANADRSFGLQEKQMTWQQEQAKAAQERESRDKRIGNLRWQAANGDAYSRAIAQDQLEQEMSGGSTAPSVSAPGGQVASNGRGRSDVANWKSELVSPQQGPPDEAAYRETGASAGAAMPPLAAGAASAHPEMSPRARFFMAQFEALQAKEKAKEDRATQVFNYDFQNQKENDAVARREKSTAFDRARLERIADDPNREPRERADAERRLAMLQSDSSMPATTGWEGATHGLRGAVGGAMANAFKQIGESSRDKIANDPLYNVNPMAQKRWDTQQTVANRQLDREGRETVAEKGAVVNDILDNDPIAKGRVEELKGAAARLQQQPLKSRVLRGLGRVALGAGNLIFDLPEYQAAPADVKALYDEVDAIAKDIASRYPEAKEEEAKQRIIAQILGGVTNDLPGVAKQIRGALRPAARPAP